MGPYAPSDLGREVSLYHLETDRTTETSSGSHLYPIPNSRSSAENARLNLERVPQLRSKSPDFSDHNTRTSSESQHESMVRHRVPVTPQEGHRKATDDTRAPSDTSINFDLPEDENDEDDDVFDWPKNWRVDGISMGLFTGYAP